MWFPVSLLVSVQQLMSSSDSRQTVLCQTGRARLQQPRTCPAAAPAPPHCSGGELAGVCRWPDRVLSAVVVSCLCRLARPAVRQIPTLLPATWRLHGSCCSWCCRYCCGTATAAAAAGQACIAACCFGHWTRDRSVYTGAAAVRWVRWRCYSIPWTQYYNLHDSTHLTVNKRNWEGGLDVA